MALYIAWLAVQLGVGGHLLGEVNPGGGGIFIDLLNLEWWQAVVGILVALGLSPAPWILGLAAGRIMFRSDLERQLATQAAAHERDLEAREQYHAALLAGEKARYADLAQSNTANREAAERERERAEQATATLELVTEALEANSHIMAAFRDSAERVAGE